MRRIILLVLQLFAASVAMLDESAAQIIPDIAWFMGYSKSVEAVALSPNGRQAVSGGGDNVLRLWDVATGLPLRLFNAETNRIGAVAFSPDGRAILLACGGKLCLWDIGSGQTVKTFEGHAGEVTAVAFSADGRKAVSGSKDKTVKLWDIETGALVKTLEGHADEVASVAFAPGGGHVLSGSKDKTLRLWDVETGLAKTFEGHADGVTSVALSRDGVKALSGSSDKTVKLWDAATGQTLKTFEGHLGAVLSVAFSSDNRVLSASEDKTLKLWDVATGALIRDFAGHSGSVTSAAVSSDGGIVLSGSSDKTLKVWDLESGQIKRTIDLEAAGFRPNGYRNAYFGMTPEKKADPVELDKRLREKGLKRGSPAYLRIFKADLELELWVMKAQRFELFAAYPICAWSGQIGPKLAEGDWQAPEGFYTIGKEQLNPSSRYYRAFNLGYPNAFDRALNRTGSFVMIHGACASAGCYAMTDTGIDEIWHIVTAALDGGQTRVPVHVFPFRMSEERLAAFDWHPSSAFWQDLKHAYDLFEKSRVPPLISVCNNRYTARPGTAPGNYPELEMNCPGKADPWRAKQQSRRDERPPGDANARGASFFTRLLSR
jgi:murein L,D-transpeptidase YafK